MTSLVIVHDGLVDSVGTVDQLALSTPAILLVKQGNTVVHLHSYLGGG